MNWQEALTAITIRLETISSVVGAFLSGSLVNEHLDDFSDIDLGIATKNSARAFDETFVLRHELGDHQQSGASYGTITSAFCPESFVLNRGALTGQTNILLTRDSPRFLVVSISWCYPNLKGWAKTPINAPLCDEITNVDLAIRRIILFIVPA